MSTPDITPMQKIVGALTAVITVALETVSAFGVGLTVNQDTKLLALWGALSAFALTADAIIRQGRAKHLAIVKAAEITAMAAERAATPLVTVSSSAAGPQPSGSTITATVTPTQPRSKRKPAARKPAARKPRSTT